MFYIEQGERRGGKKGKMKEKCNYYHNIFDTHIVNIYIANFSPAYFSFSFLFSLPPFPTPFPPPFPSMHQDKPISSRT